MHRGFRPSGARFTDFRRGFYRKTRHPTCIPIRKVLSDVCGEAENGDAAGTGFHFVQKRECSRRRFFAFYSISHRRPRVNRCGEYPVIAIPSGAIGTKPGGSA